MTELDPSLPHNLPVTSPAPHTKLPLALKLLYTAFTAVLTVYYWREYGPTNFLYFCDIALFLALAAVWTERPIYASMAAIGITIPQLFWQVDFLARLADAPITNMTAYMLDEKISLFARCLSFFHFWLPIFLLYLVWRLGYDRRAFAGWTLLAWALILVAFFLLPGPGDPLDFPNQPHNVNYVYGLDDDLAQNWIPQWSWLALLLVGLPLLFYLPTHVALSWLDRFHQNRLAKAAEQNGAAASAAS